MTTRALLSCGMAAGPVYVLVGLAQVLTREGFDVRRHALSLLSNGHWGWIQIANVFACGALVVAGARACVEPCPACGPSASLWPGPVRPGPPGTLRGRR